MRTMKPSSKAGLAILCGVAIGAAVILIGRMVRDGAPVDDRASGSPSVVSFERDGKRCFTVKGERGVGGNGGDATVCGEGSVVSPGAAGGRMGETPKPPPTYAIRGGKLLRLEPDVRAVPVEGQQ